MAQQNPPPSSPAAPTSTAGTPKSDSAIAGSAAGSNEEQRRRENGAEWARRGFMAYGNNTGPLDRLGEISTAHVAHDDAALQAGYAGTVYRVAGRVMLQREQGKLRFVTLRDGTGEI